MADVGEPNPGRSGDPLPVDAVLRYRIGRATWFPLALTGVAILVVAMLAAGHGMPSATTVVPVGVVLPVLLWLALRPMVTLTPHAIAVRTLWGVQGHAWSEVAFVELDGPRVWVTTPHGRLLLPAPTDGSPWGRPSGPRLCGAIWRRWHDGRGPAWTPSLHPWTPQYDSSGRVVLREPLLLSLALAPTYLVILWFYMFALSSETWTNGVGAAVGLTTVFLANIGSNRRSSRVRIDPDGVTTSGVLGSTHIPWDDVSGLREDPGTWERCNVHLVRTDGSAVKLRALRTTCSIYSYDPDYHRKLVWLHDQLDAHRSAPQSDERFDQARDRGPRSDNRDN